jgi:hypothetical protein
VPPKSVLLLSLESGEAFWAGRGYTLLFDTVAYQNLTSDHLRDWAREDRPGASEEDAVWKLLELGLFDMQVRDRGVQYTLIDDWIVREKPKDLGSPMRFLRNKQRLSADIYGSGAREIIEGHLRNVETYPAIAEFHQRMIGGTLPAPNDNTDRLRESLRKALLGGRATRAAIIDLQNASSGQNNSEELLELAFEMKAYQAPEINEDEFLSRVAPLWRRVSRLQLAS